MADDQKAPSGPDLAQGVASGDFKNDMLVGHVGDQDVLLVRSRRRDLRDRRALQPLSRAARRRARGRRQRALSVASRLLRSAHRRGARAPALSPLAVWKVEQESGRIFVRQKTRSAATGEEAPADAPRQDRDRRRRRGGLCGGRDAAARRLWRRDHDAEQRRCAAGRPAEPVEGLSRRQCAGGLGAAAAGQLLCRVRHQSAAQDQRRLDRRAARAMSCSPTARRCPTTGCCSQPAPSR